MVEEVYDFLRSTRFWGRISFLNDCVLTLKARKAVSFGARSFPCTEIMTPAARSLRFKFHLSFPDFAP